MSPVTEPGGHCSRSGFISALPVSQACPGRAAPPRSRWSPSPRTDGRGRSTTWQLGQVLWITDPVAYGRGELSMGGRDFDRAWYTRGVTLAVAIYAAIV